MGNLFDDTSWVKDKKNDNKPKKSLFSRIRDYAKEKPWRTALMVAGVVIGAALVTTAIVLSAGILAAPAAAAAAAGTSALAGLFGGAAGTAGMLATAGVATAAASIAAAKYMDIKEMQAERESASQKIEKAQAAAQQNSQNKTEAQTAAHQPIVTKQLTIEEQIKNKQQEINDLRNEIVERQQANEKDIMIGLKKINLSGLEDELKKLQERMSEQQLVAMASHQSTAGLMQKMASVQGLDAAAVAKSANPKRQGDGMKIQETAANAAAVKPREEAVKIDEPPSIPAKRR